MGYIVNLERGHLFGLDNLLCDDVSVLNWNQELLFGVWHGKLSV